VVLSRKKADEILSQRINEAAEEESKKKKEKAKYKIQISFVSDRKLHDACSYTISFWESGLRMHGGGDEMMFICRRHEDAPKVIPLEVAGPKANVGPRGCGMLIPGGLAEMSGIIVCPHCQTAHRTDQIGDSVFYKTPISSAAKVLAEWWRKLDRNADIYVKFSPTDPRTKLMMQSEGFRRARELKGLTIYPLKNIIRDTVGGSTLESRFEALLTS